MLDLDNETITLDELKLAMTQILVTSTAEGGGFGKVAYPHAVAESVFIYVVSHREPVYVDNGLYQDADGGVYLYKAASRIWQVPSILVGRQWTVTYPINIPRRPMTRLVPETKE